MNIYLDFIQFTNDPLEFYCAAIIAIFYMDGRTVPKIRMSDLFAISIHIYN